MEPNPRLRFICSSGLELSCSRRLALPFTYDFPHLKPHLCVLPICNCMPMTFFTL
uniref:Uncharacterized protein n=1 Tax=Picea sitchensis TaxID=3332 RepID=A9P191_PICSI|nr:unknown [Picea sitchensis]